CSKICQGDGMGRYRFRTGGTLRRTTMEKSTSLTTTQGRQLGSIHVTDSLSLKHLLTASAMSFLLVGKRRMTSTWVLTTSTMLTKRHNSRTPDKSGVLSRRLCSGSICRPHRTHL
ncbi:hypothetical protein QAD02_015452, partial [Eretmocerus hayati]